MFEKNLESLEAFSDLNLKILLVLNHSDDSGEEDHNLFKKSGSYSINEFFETLNFLHQFDCIDCDDTNADTHIYRITPFGKECLHKERLLRLEKETDLSSKTFPNLDLNNTTIASVAALHNVSTLTIFSLAIAHFLELPKENRQAILNRYASKLENKSHN